MATHNSVNLGLSGSTGAGSFVGSSAPTIVNGVWQSPTINSPSGTVLTVSSTGTPVNQFVMTASPTTAAPILSAAGTDTNILLQINGKGTSGVGIQGTSTNSSAVAGNVGEVFTSIVTSGSPVFLTTGTSANVTSISLTAGDWDVWGNTTYQPAATTNVVNWAQWISSTSATLPARELFSINSVAASGVVTGGSTLGMAVPSLRFSLAGTTTIYLSSYATFSVDTLNVVGGIYARRRR